MDLPDSSDPLDTVLRHVSRLFPEQLARALAPPGATLTIHGWPDTQVASRQRRLDCTLDATVNGERRLLHNEWQLKMTADLPFRIYEYSTLLVLGLADELALAVAQAKLDDPDAEPSLELPPIESTLVLLSGREEPWPTEGEFRTSPKDAPFSGVRFRIEPVYQRTVAELEAKGSLLWLIFAPLAVDATGEKMGEVIRRLQAQAHTRREFEELAVAMTAVADADKRGRCLREQIVAFLPEEIVMESWVFKQGVEKGRGEGKAEGRAEGKAEAVLRVLRARRFEVPGAARERILHCTDLTLLDTWLDRSATIQDVAELFEEAAHTS